MIMRIKILTSVVAFVLMVMLTVNISAQERIIYENVYNHGSFVNKEFVSIDKVTKIPISKRLHIVNDEGQTLETVEYKWNNATTGWEVIKKNEYAYNENNLLISTICTKWDSSKKKWSDMVDQMTYNYDKNGGLASVDKVSKKRTELLAERK